MSRPFIQLDTSRLFLNVLIAIFSSITKLRRVFRIIFSLGALTIISPCSLLKSQPVKADYEFYVEKDSGTNTERIKTEVIVNEKIFKLFVDTGSSCEICLHVKAARKNGIEISRMPAKIPTLPGTTTFGESVPCTVTFRNVRKENYRFTIWDFAPAESDTFDGIFGWRILEQNQWAFLLAENKVLMIGEIPERVLKWTTFDIVSSDGRLSLVEANPSGEGKLRLLIDTGMSSGIMLPPLAWQAWKNENKAAKVTLELVTMPGAQGAQILEQGWANEYKIAGITFKGVPIAEASAGYTVQARPGENVVAIGLHAFKGLEMVIDGPNKRAYIKSLETAIPNYDYNRVGLVFVNDGHPLLSARVAEHSPAAKAGIRNGDFLVGLNNVDFRDWKSVPEKLSLLSWHQPEGTQFFFRLSRSGDTFDTTVIGADFLRSCK